MKTFYVVIHGYIGRILDPETDCKIVENEKEAIKECKKLEDTEYLTLKLDKNMTELEIKKMSLAEIW